VIIGSFAARHQELEFVTLAWQDETVDPVKACICVDVRSGACELARRHIGKHAWMVAETTPCGWKQDLLEIAAYLQVFFGPEKTAHQD
jgi:hypothetical protein